MTITIKINDALIYTVSDLDLDVLAYEIDSDVIETLLGQRIMQQIINKIAQVQKSLMDEWAYKGLALNGVTTVPLDREALLTLIFAQSNYLDRKARDLLES